MNDQGSVELPKIAAAGETQHVEFKASLPRQADDLAKEIAAFATSNMGTIFIGIEDDGTIVGLPECETHQGREQLKQRLQGICAHHSRAIS